VLAVAIREVKRSHAVISGLAARRLYLFDSKLVLPASFGNAPPVSNLTASVKDNPSI